MRKTRVKALKEIVRRGMVNGLVSPDRADNAFRRMKTAWVKSKVFRQLVEKSVANDRA